MSTEDIGAVAPTDTTLRPTQDSMQDQIECAKQPSAPTFLHSPPDSNNTAKSEASDSELSDLDEEPPLEDAPTLKLPAEPALPTVPPQAAEEKQEEEDIGEVLPDHWSNGGVPVFRPTMKQFKDFKLFMRKVDSYGMKSGIIKIIPPDEWKDAQPPLDELVKQVRVREPIKQDIMGSNGTYRQVNILHGRSYNVPQWRQLCEQSEHQPPARRGERRANADKPKPRTRAAASKTANPPSSGSKKRGKGRPPKNKSRGKGKANQEDDDQRPMTPVSPQADEQNVQEEPVTSIEDTVDSDTDLQDQQPVVRRMGGTKPAKPKTQSTSARRKYSRREGSAAIDEAAFKDFDYRMDISEYTPERCEELERAYWKTLTYAPPLYGADLMGTLFDDRTEIWNLNKLPNILDVLGTKVPGVNTAYLYLGMWKATFAWHLEDVDLYSINYLHFGAPKQWYSISQGDARRFEAAMKSIWPTDAKACDQFLRHKAFLISPQNLLQNYGIRVNKCVSYPGEFVVTYPYGYHSGYNLGYNCAEAVNFALDSWLEMGKIAKKCDCAQAQDSVWINVYEIERKLRGEETEYEETDEEEDDDDDDDDDEIQSGLPTPPTGHGVKFKERGRKRKRGPNDKSTKIKVKKIKLRVKSRVEPPCCLCPNDIPGMELLPTDDGRKVHRLCALYLPETYIDLVDGGEHVSNLAGVHKDRLDLKCLFCRSKRGACFQCSQKKCARAYHPTCAAAAGVFVEEEEVPVFGEDGQEYKEQAFEFSCRFHRSRRDKKLDGDALEDDKRIQAAAQALKQGDICQVQYHRGDIFAGMVVENRTDERTLLLDILPHGERVEVEWKWLLLPDPSDYHLPKASANAISMPLSRKAKDKLKAKRSDDEKPRKDDEFVEGFTWAEFNTQDATNKDQVAVDFSKPDQIWFYLGSTSTEAKAQYTEDPAKPRHNPKGNYLDTIPKPPKPAPAPKAAPHRPQFYASKPVPYPYIGMGTMATANAGPPRQEKPYVYKPKKPSEPCAPLPAFTPARFTPSAPSSSVQAQPTAPYNNGFGYTSTHGHVASYGGVDMTSRQPQTSQRQQIWNPSSQPHTTASFSPHVASHGGTPRAQGNLTASASTSNQTSHLVQIQQQRKPSYQVTPSVYQKYPFFQVHHNRDSTKYRTPYASWGGFTNGYQGDIRAYLTSNQSDLLRRVSLGSLSTQPNQASGYGGAAPYTSMSSRSPAAAQSPNVQSSAMTERSPSIPGTPQQHPPGQQSMHSIDGQGHQATASQTHQPATQFVGAPPANKPKSFPAVKALKIGLPAAIEMSRKSTKSAIQVPAKQSPVPLPANFLAAMTTAPSTATSTKTTSQRDTSAEPKRTEQGLPPAPAATAAPVIAKPAPSKMSLTPVPLPKFPTSVSNQVLGVIEKNEARNCPNVDHAAGRSQIEATPQNVPDASSASIPASTKTLSSYPEFRPVGCALTTNHAHAAAPVRRMNNHLQGGYEPMAPSGPIGVQPKLGQSPQTQEFPDVPGCESMEFVERMMQNLRRASQRSDE
ncbi:hypothetical protein S7711_03177 [Stachybotrys chartarum IBT 7711]|uniref:[histone H3]-trimethyl-L-lysine(9) demethylase n=1 Tax=Stachybotrys chartarum (strain CBS 109288 / IBT 7711) TaxID=1280523 RepID=A0A084AWL2_STACB|nr:hypothetical protein S7711_03177 [Stachybotrys chartarum IBT 7711]